VSQSAEKAYQTILEGIISAQFAPGQHLKEEELSHSIGVSRTPIREALRRLANEGLVKFAQNQGTFVETFSIEDIDEVFQLRSMLEAHGAARAALRIGQAAIDALERSTDELDALRENQNGADITFEFNRLNAEFHKIILQTAESKRLSTMLATIIDLPLILMKHYNWQTYVDLPRSCQQHRELIDAMKARDPVWASSLMRAHVLGARGDLNRLRV